MYVCVVGGGGDRRRAVYGFACMHGRNEYISYHATTNVSIRI